jgi:hypothetical protein
VSVRRWMYKAVPVELCSFELTLGYKCDFTKGSMQKSAVTLIQIHISVRDPQTHPAHHARSLQRSVQDGPCKRTFSATSDTNKKGNYRNGYIVIGPANLHRLNISGLHLPPFGVFVCAKKFQVFFVAVFWNYLGMS